MQNQHGTEELLSDMLIKQDEQTEVLKTNSEILREHTAILKGLIEGQNDLVRGQKLLVESQNRLETKFDGLFSYLGNNVIEE